MNRIPTHVYRLKHDQEAASKSLALIIPGSPGMGHLYIPFATRLFQLGAGNYDVALVSHAGHSPGFLRPPTDHTQDKDFPGNSAEKFTNGAAHLSTNVASSRSHRDWYCLEEQIQHKLAFLEQYAPEVDTLYFVGHSIGSWMVLQMMKRLEPSKIKKAILLFPMIERMGETPKGVRLAPLFSSLRLPFTFLVWCLSCIPDSVKRFILSYHFYTTPLEQVPHMTQGAINIDSKAIHNVLCMAKQEMEEVTATPFDIIDKNIEKLVFYYGVGDAWNMSSCYSDMCKRYPDHKEIHLCKSGHAHAFVEAASNDMAEFAFSKILP